MNIIFFTILGINLLNTETSTYVRNLPQITAMQIFCGKRSFLFSLGISPTYNSIKSSTSQFVCIPIHICTSFHHQWYCKIQKTKIQTELLLHGEYASCKDNVKIGSHLSLINSLYVPTKSLKLQADLVYEPPINFIPRSSKQNRIFGGKTNKW